VVASGTRQSAAASKHAGVEQSQSVNISIGHRFDFRRCDLSIAHGEEGAIGGKAHAHVTACDYHKSLRTSEPTCVNEERGS